MPNLLNEFDFFRLLREGKLCMKIILRPTLNIVSEIVSKVLWSWIRLKILVDKKMVNINRRYRFEYWSRRLQGLGDGTNFYGRVVIYNPQNVTVGANSTLNEGVIIIAKTEGIQIGNHVRISANVLIAGTGLDTEKWSVPYSHVSKPVDIEDGVWIGSGAQIMPGIRLGRQCVVAAGAVVTRDVEPSTIVAGIPAGIVGRIGDTNKTE